MPQKCDEPFCVLLTLLPNTIREGCGLREACGLIWRGKSHVRFNVLDKTWTAVIARANGYGLFCSIDFGVNDASLARDARLGAAVLENLDGG